MRSAISASESSSGALERGCFMANEPLETAFTRAAEAEFAKAAQGVGLVAMAWNRLHARLAKFFVQLTTPEREALGQAAWHSLKTDRAQRDMLSAVISASRPEDDPAAVEVQWVLSKLNDISSGRNEAVHVPFSMEIGEDKKLHIVPDHWDGHPLAKRLFEKGDTHKQLAAYHAAIGALYSHFKEAATYFFSPPQIRGALPKRPELLEDAAERPPGPQNRKERRQEQRRQRGASPP